MSDVALEDRIIQHLSERLDGESAVTPVAAARFRCATAPGPGVARASAPHRRAPRPAIRVAAAVGLAVVITLGAGSRSLNPVTWQRHLASTIVECRAAPGFLNCIRDILNPSTAQAARATVRPPAPHPVIVAVAIPPPAPATATAAAPVTAAPAAHRTPHPASPGATPRIVAPVKTASRAPATAPPSAPTPAPSASTPLPDPAAPAHVITLRSISDAGTAPSGSRVFTAPAPSGMTAGDTLIAVLQANGAPGSTISAPPGWMLIADARGLVIAGRSSPVVTASYVHVATSADPAGWTWTTSTLYSGVLHIADYTGVDTATPILGSQPGGAAFTTTAHFAAQTVTVSALSLIAVTVDGTSPQSITPPAACGPLWLQRNDEYGFACAAGSATGSGILPAETVTYTGATSWSGVRIELRAA